MDSTFYAVDDGQLAGLVLRTVAWLVVVVACLVAVRRPWAWPGLAGGLLGLAAYGAYLVDDLMVRHEVGSDTLGAHVFDDNADFPGFILDHDLYGELDWLQTAAFVLVAVAFVTGAVLSRRRGEPSSAA